MKPSYHDSDSKIAIVLSLVSLVLALKKLFSVIITPPAHPSYWNIPVETTKLSMDPWERLELAKNVPGEDER